MIIYSTIQKSQLEGAHRIDAEYYQPEYLENKKILERIGNLKLIKIPLIKKEKIQEEVEEIIRGAQKEFRFSQSLYSQAEVLLLEGLGLKNFKPKENLSYVVNLSDVKSAHRSDAEYFQPKYEELIGYLRRKFELRKLGDLVSAKKGIEPGSEKYQEEGTPFLRVSNLSKFEINDKDQKYLSEDFYQELRKDYQPQVGEILLTKDASPGIAYVVKEYKEGIIAGGILRLKVKTDVETEYLSLVINSIIGQLQMEQDTGGSVIIHWRPEQIKNCLIPILPKPTQQKIASLVRRSHQSHKKAKELLGDAKRKVEEMIEKKK